MQLPDESPRFASPAQRFAHELDVARQGLAQARGPLGIQRLLLESLERALPGHDLESLARTVRRGSFRDCGLSAEAWMFTTALLESARAAEGALAARELAAPVDSERGLQQLLWGLSKAEDEEALCRTVLEAVRDAVGAQRVSLVRPVGDGTILEVLALSGEEGGLVAGTRLPRENTGVGAIFDAQEPSVRAIDPKSDCLEDQVLRKAGLRHTLGVPVRCGGPALAVINAATTLPAGFEEQDLQGLTRIAQLFGAFWEAWAERRSAFEARQRAEEANELKGHFLATMSHEIRTPMNGILGLASVLSESDLAEPMHGYATTIYQSCEALLTIVNDVLDWSKIEAGKLDLEHTEFDLDDSLSSVLRLFDGLAHSKGLELVDECSDSLPKRAIGDPLRLRQILSNLLSNAIKFTTEGSVTLRARRVPARPGRLRLEFAVEDTGIGISQQVQDRLFEPFTQADTATSRKFGGSGLGLAICRHLVEAHGGELGVRSEFGAGATFHFTLELHEAGAGIVAPEETVDTTTDLSHLKVLVAEDHPINQRVATALLARLGIEADVADDGALALEAVQRGQYHLVLMDLSMPEMDGFESAERIVALDLENPPAIVACTANAIDEDRDRCFRVGMQDFIAKPFRLDELRSALERAVDARAAA